MKDKLLEILDTKDIAIIPDLDYVKCGKAIIKGWIIVKFSLEERKRLYYKKPETRLLELDFRNYDIIQEEYKKTIEDLENNQYNPLMVPGCNLDKELENQDPKYFEEDKRSFKFKIRSIHQVITYHEH